MESASSNASSCLLFTALSLSVGWGVRGNFGHEFGAMIPGALAAMAAVLLSGRADWHRRIAWFGFFGALGWSIGGSVSYMQVIAYTHSGHSPSVLYGFACLFVIGFLWAAIGGAGTALPALLDREQLTEFFAPLTAVFIAWLLQDLAEHWFFAVNPDFRQRSPLYWYDTNWLAAFTAAAAVIVLALARRRIDPGSSLLLHAAMGWWIGFLVLVNLLGLRMTPPRGDNWAGCVGLVGGLLIYFSRRGCPGMVWAMLTAGLIGGFGFATATLLKLVEITSGLETNWHSVLEQTYGFINGLGIAAMMLGLAARAPRVHDEPPVRRWTEIYAVTFVLVVVTWLNLHKNPGEWVRVRAMPPSLYGLPALTWFNLAYLALAVVTVALLVRHRRRPLPLIPGNWLGKGQWLYLVLLWWIVIGNFERALVSFAPQRLVTEGVIFLNAVLCTGLLLLGCPGQQAQPAIPVTSNFSPWIRRTMVVGLIGMVLSTLADWGVARAIYGDRFAGYAGKHIRFGPNATATKEKPRPDQPHP